MIDEPGWGGGNVWYYKRKAGGGGCDYPLPSPNNIVLISRGWGILYI